MLTSCLEASISCHDGADIVVPATEREACKTTSRMMVASMKAKARGRRQYSFDQGRGLHCVDGRTGLTGMKKYMDHLHL